VWYASNKSLDDSFTWTPSISGVSIDDLAADYRADGSLTLFWSGESPGRSEGYVAQLSSGGGVTHAPFVATDDTLAALSSPSVAVSENGDVSLTWLDRRGGSAQVYYQIFDPGLSPVGVNAPVSAQTPEFMKQPYTEAFRGRAWYVWSDPRAEGMNIYCAGVLYDPTGVDDGDQMLPSEYRLAQNYPNPFNPSTVISFTLPTQSRVTLDVFNVLGRRVATLVDDDLSVGEHYVTWSGEDSDGKRVASGVYFYRLSTDAFTQTRKMMLLK
jgi:hypothetical protein